MLNQYEIEGRYPEERQKILSKTPEYLFDEILEKASEFIQWCWIT
jgi:HEPN domain-containing protein